MKIRILIATLVGLTACQNQQRVTVPNRALDRPMDTEIACVFRTDDGEVLVAPGSACRGDTQESTPSFTECSDRTRVIGFVTNSERNEIGMFRRCDPNGLVDMDPSSPGYDFLPAGELPQELTLTRDACRAVSANTQSCDLTMVDVPQAARHAYSELEPSKAGGALSWEITPILGDGTPLAARPAEIIAVPGGLSLAGAPTGGGGVGGSTGGGTTSGGMTSGDGTGTATGASSAGEDTGVPPGAGFNSCSDEEPYSVYVTFPACQLVAEVNLLTGQVLQSRQFVRQDDGTFEVIDTGTQPACPVECPDQFDGGVPPSVEGDADGLYPTAMELALKDPPGNVEHPDMADDQLSTYGYDAVFVAGPGGDYIFEIPVSDAGFGPPEDVRSLLLEDPEGIHRVRVSPPLVLSSGGLSGQTQQFIYAVAGDGSTHVVQRFYDDVDELGLECDTQVDPSEFQAALAGNCQPVDPGFPGTPPDRRPLALGPGIRAPGGATINDWTFLKIRDGDLLKEGDSNPQGVSTLGAPVGGTGVVGVGVTSFGRVVLSIFDQASEASQVTALDPLGIMDVSLRPHMLLPFRDPQSGLAEAMPRLDGSEPEREIPSSAEATAVLSPSVRRIDLAYARASEDDEVTPEQQYLSQTLGNPGNVDLLGSFLPLEESGRLYERAVARVVARDYRRWTGGAWALVWEGIIPGTTSSTGKVQCDGPGWQGGTCLPPPAHYVPASFGSCGDDSECPDGMSCDGETCLVPGPGCPGGWTLDTALGRCVKDCTMDAQCDELAAVSGQTWTCQTGDRPGCRLSDEARQRTSRLVDEGASFCDTGVLPGDTLLLLGCDDDDDCGIGQRCLQDRVSDDSGICFSAEALDEREEELRQICEPFISDPCGEAPREFLITHSEQEELWLQSVDRPERSYLVKDPNAGDDDQGANGLDDEFITDLVVEKTARFSCVLPAGAEQPAGGCDDDDVCQEEIGADYLCIEGLCRIDCTQVEGMDACRETPLPGPACFEEFLRYQVRLRDSFLVTGTPVGGFFPNRVVADPDTGACVEDPTVSPLLTSRLWLGKDADETFNHPVRGIPACQSDDPTPLDPNPCRIVTPRSADATTRFHTFPFADLGEVPAIRFTNPYISFVVDLTSLLGLGSEIPDRDKVTWRPERVCPVPLVNNACPVPEQSFADFRRARIPDNYRETFGTAQGYSPVNDGILTVNVPMVYPVRVIPAPEQFGGVYVVDSGGRGGLQGVRGQVVRVLFLGNQLSGDDSFRVR